MSRKEDGAEEEQKMWLSQQGFHLVGEVDEKEAHAHCRINQCIRAASPAYPNRILRSSTVDFSCFRFAIL